MQAHAPVYHGEFQPPPKQYRPKPNQQNTVYQLNKQPIKQSQAQQQSQPQQLQQQPTQSHPSQQQHAKLPQQYQQPMPFAMRQFSESTPSSSSPTSSKFFRMLQTITDTLPEGAGMGANKWRFLCLMSHLCDTPYTPTPLSLSPHPHLPSLFVAGVDLSDKHPPWRPCDICVYICPCCCYTPFKSWWNESDLLSGSWTCEYTLH